MEINAQELSRQQQKSRETKARIFNAAKQILQEHLSIYFRSYDGDYKDLKRLLGMDPLRVTVLRTGTIEAYTRRTGRTVLPVGAPREVVLDILRLQENGAEGGDAQ